jgi:hypothetical protein
LRVRVLKRVLVAVAVVAGVLALLVGAQFALIEIGREVVVVHEPTPSGAIHRSRLWIVDDGGVSWIHPGNANARWWVAHMKEHSTVEIERGGETRTYHASADPAADPKVHRLMRQKYGIADRWVRYLSGSDSETGLLTGKKCTTVPIRLEPTPTAQ